MYCTRKVNNDITWVGGNDRRLAMFEGVYSIPDGVSYNSYLIMNEKTMVADALTGVNGELKMFGDMIPQTENKELKQCLKQIRSQCEMSQEKLYQIAREKSYYVPAEKATREEVEHVKSILSAN